MTAGPENVFRDKIRALSAYHVADAAGLVKLDAMENPYALPPELVPDVAAALAASEVNRYPDPSARRLKTAIRSAFSVPDDLDILVGNGSDEIIQMIALAAARPGAVMVGLEPGFAMYRMTAVYAGMRYEPLDLAPDFSLDLGRVLDAVRRIGPAVVFVAYPNNPTGNLFPHDAILAIADATAGLVVVDEAYHAFARRSLLGEVSARPNLLVMRTVSKLGLAGLRLGFLAGPARWLVELDKVRLPYNVNVYTQAAATAVLNKIGLLDEQAAEIVAERERLCARLRGMPGVTTFPSDANFLLFRIPDASSISARIRERGVLIKDLSRAHPLLKDCLRVTVGLPMENQRFIDALTDSLPT